MLLFSGSLCSEEYSCWSAFIITIGLSPCMWPCCLSLTTITPALPKQITWRSWSFSNGSSNYSQEWDCPSMANMFIVEITSTPAILWHSSWPTWSSKNVSFVYLYLRGMYLLTTTTNWWNVRFITWLSINSKMVSKKVMTKLWHSSWPTWSSKNVLYRLFFVRFTKFYT